MKLKINSRILYLMLFVTSGSDEKIKNVLMKKTIENIFEGSYKNPFYKVPFFK